MTKNKNGKAIGQTTLMPIQVLQRLDCHGDAKNIGDCFLLHKEADGRQIHAVCQLWSHQFGWELRLVIDGGVNRTQVCRTQEEVFDTYEDWKRSMIERDWK